jgi:type I restriction enzyme, S subunit
MPNNQSYPSYKTSGVEWIGDVPEHWEVWKLAHLTTRIGSGKTPTGGATVYKDEGVAFLRSQNVYDDGLRLDDVAFIDDSTDSEMAWSRVKPHDILLNITGASLGRTCIVPRNFLRANVNQHVCVIRLQDNSNAKFLAYYLKSKPAKSLYEYVQTGSAREGLNFQQIGAFQILIPSSEEQSSIVSFLDYKTAQIDALIARKEALLTKLAEKRTALISHAVTKGLDSSAPMKDSGVAWLGDAPAHWQFKRLRFLTTMAGGMTPNTSTPEYWDGDIPWVSPKDMKRELLNGSIDKLTEKGVSDTGIRLHESGRILIVVRGMILAHTFPVAINGIPVTINQDMKALSTSLSSEYLAILLRGIKSLVLSIVEESAHGTKILRTDLLKNIVLPVPPYEEQDIIVKEVNGLTVQTDQMSQIIQLAIDRLVEYRSALITNAVTGKIDVRDFKIPATDGESSKPELQPCPEATSPTPIHPPAEREIAWL